MLNKKYKKCYLKCNYSPDSAPIFFLVAAPRQFRAIIDAAVNALTIKNLFLVVLQTIMVSPIQRNSVLYMTINQLIIFENH